MSVSAYIRTPALRTGGDFAHQKFKFSDNTLWELVMVTWVENNFQVYGSFSS